MSDALDLAETQLLFAPIEAILMVVDQPVTAQQLAGVLNVSAEDIEHVLEALSAQYAGRSGGREHGFELRRLGGGWRVYSAPRWESLVSQFIVGTGQSKLSQAALETLAVIAYRQPISRARISQIRGVNVDAVVRTLSARELIEEVGQSSSGARLYGTTQVFLERMGMNSLDELAPLAPYLPASDELDELEETL